VLLALLLSASTSHFVPRIALVLAFLTTAAHAADTPRHRPPRAVPNRPRPPTFVFGLVLQQDAAFVGGSDVCTKDSQLNQGFSCFRASGSQYHGTPINGVRDGVGSGVLFATSRLALTGDYMIAEDLALGARAGWALRGGGPAPDGGSKFKPFSGDVRLSYFISGPAFDPDGFAPYLFLAAGAMQIDAHIGVDVVEDPNAPPPPNQPDNPPGQHLDAYKKMGYSFVGAGAGAWFPLSPASGVRLELGAMQLFPSTGTALYLAGGLAFGT
jgi:hypothetical protein